MVQKILTLLLVFILGLATPAMAAYSPTAWDYTQTSTGSNTLVINSATFQTINTTSGSVTLTLPSAVAARGKVFAFKRITSASNTATVQRAGSDTIDGSTSFTMSLNQVVILQSDGTTTWKVLTDSSTFQPSDATLTALAAFNTNGLLTQTAADTFAGRTLTGTANQIDITNGNGVSGNPTAALASNLTMPGTAGFLPPSGNTAARGSTDGQIRYNSQTGKLEGREGGSWGDLISSGSGGYDTIQEEGSSLTQRTTLDVVSTNLTASDTGSKTQLALSNNLDKLIESDTVSINGPTTLTASSNSIQRADNSSNPVAYNLPSVASCPGKIFTFIKTSTASNTVAVTKNATDSSNILAGANSISTGAVNNTTSFTIQSNGTTWDLLSNSLNYTSATFNNEVTTSPYVSSSTLFLSQNFPISSIVSSSNIGSAISGSGIMADTGSSVINRSILVGSTKLTVANGTGISGDPTVDVGNLAGTTGLVVQTTSTTNSSFTARTITGTSLEIAVANGSGTGGNPTLSVPSNFIPNNIADGRLTLTSNTPVTTSDVTAATTIYYTPYRGNKIGLHTGSKWVICEFTQISSSLSGLTANRPYDVFVYDTNGDGVAETLDVVAWTNSTTRATALAYQNGILVKSGTTTRRYVGTIQITGTTGQCEDSASKRLVWNYYNRVSRPMSATSSATSWSYSTNTWRQMNGGTGSVQVSFVTGVAEDQVSSSTKAFFSTSNANRAGYVGIGLDSTSTNSAQLTGSNTLNQSTPQAINAFFTGIPSIGGHTLYPLEAGNGSTTTTWYGSGNDSFSIPGIIATYQM